jgi:hypothetical protein
VDKVITIELVAGGGMVSVFLEGKHAGDFDLGPSARYGYGSPYGRCSRCGDPNGNGGCPEESRAELIRKFDQARREVLERLGGKDLESFINHTAASDGEDRDFL